MNVYARLMTFSLIACPAYTLAYYFDWSLFQYYTGDNAFHIMAQAPASGPPILWYGWLATAVLAGLAGAILVPPRLFARFLPDLLWLVPATMFAAALFYEKRWFM